MAVYLIAQVKVIDGSWIPKYAEKVHDIVHKHGGKYLARSANITNFEGDPLDTSMIALIEFPALDSARAFADDPEYAPYLQARSDGTVSLFNVIDDTDAAGTIPYLEKG